MQIVSSFVANSLISAHGPKGSEGDPNYIFFTLNTCQASFISDFCETTAGIGKKWKCDVRTDGRTEGQTDVMSEIVI